MNSDATTAWEQSRLDELRKYAILDTKDTKDTKADPALDRITQLAATICQTPIAAITFIDEQHEWYKSVYGAHYMAQDRALAPGNLVVKDRSFVMISHLSQRLRYTDKVQIDPANSCVFYAAVPLLSENGLPLGTLAVHDFVTRQLTQPQQNALVTLAEQVMTHIELDQQRQAHQRLTKDLAHLNLALFKQAEERHQHAQSLIAIASDTARIAGWAIRLPEQELIWPEEAAQLHEMPKAYHQPTLEEVFAYSVPEYRHIVRSAYQRWHTV
ncbi:GAF domain-containing protein [Undibacterium sp. Jales W-56]|uniref:GAF domain-containing protein n=1 Tax=Undibacterium sp. Jales W-56 TaxID=2897325 RepID=UPI0021D344ED|nr:GAF domain-containing protein [Undibacterium sp. Jales W-56]MCU6435688.1 GAF domain-containing protein [Undibacterium sp. Jales W-56]